MTIPLLSLKLLRVALQEHSRTRRILLPSMKRMTLLPQVLLISWGSQILWLIFINWRS